MLASTRLRAIQNVVTQSIRENAPCDMCWQVRYKVIPSDKNINENAPCDMC